MLRLEFDNIIFENHLVLEKGVFFAKDGNITVISGESGSGKTTLLKELALYKKFAKAYEALEIDLFALDVNEQRDFLYQHITYVSQDSNLLEDLKIKDHITMYRNLFSNKKEYEEYERLLGINDLINQYPMQLSGGERKRVSLYLAILKDSDILLLDEPTASLDLENLNNVGKILQILKKEGKTVIVSTHDECIVDKADVCYHINQGKLKVITHAKDTAIDLKKESDKKAKNFKGIQKYITFMQGHKKFYHRSLKFLIIFCITLFSCSTQFSNYAMEINNSAFSNMASSTLIVYRADEGAENLGYNFNGSGQVPLTKKDVQDLKKLDHVESIEWRYDINLGYPFSLYTPYLNQKSEMGDFDLKIYTLDSNHDKMEFSRNKGDIDEIILSSFSEKTAEMNDIHMDFQQKGIYISKDLADSLCIPYDKLKDMKLGFEIYIPIYSQKGESSVDNNGKDVFLTGTSCVPLQVEMPIAGILKGSDMGIASKYSNQIYMNQEELEKLIDSQKKTEPVVMYEAFLYTDNSETDKDDIFIGSLPDNAEKEYTEIFKREYRPWSPTAYTMHIDKVSNMESVQRQLSDLGFSFSNAYADYYAISQGSESMQKMMKWASAIAAFIIILMMGLIKLNERDKINKLEVYFSNLGLTDKEILSILHKNYARRTLVLMLSCCILTLVLFFLDSNIHIMSTHINLYVLFSILILSIFVEFVLPLLIERGIHHD